MHQLVAALWRRGWRVKRPEHRDGEGERHDYGEGDVEVLAHSNRLSAMGAERKWKLSLVGFANKAKGAVNQGLGGSDKGQGSGTLVKFTIQMWPRMRYVTFEI